MEKDKPQLILLCKNGADTVQGKALGSCSWKPRPQLTLGASSSKVLPGPLLTLASGNMRPITQVSGGGGTANTRPPVVSSGPGSSRDSFPVGGLSKLDKKVAGGSQRSSNSLGRDTFPMSSLTELGKKLVAAARDGDTSQVRHLMAVGAPFSSDGPIGMTPLHLAAQNGHHETCQRLLAAGMSKDARNKVDKTPLHLAAMEGHKNIVSLLVKHGANINACDMLKMTPLHWACDRGYPAVVRLLMRNQAHINVVNKFNKTALELAVENNYHDISVLFQEGVFEKEGVGGNLVLRKGEEEDEDEEDMNVSLHSFDCHIPVVCKTEEVHTIEDVDEGTDSSHNSAEEEIPIIENELPHSIMADDLEDQSISVLATLAELAQATSRGSIAKAPIEVSSAAALELLKAQAALLPLDDSSMLVTSAVAHGQTLHLTEAGRQALHLIKKEVPLLPTSPPPKEDEEEEEEEEEEPAERRQGEWRVVKTEQHEPDPSSPSCLPSLLPVEEEEQEEVTQVITLSPEQYAALTGGTNGPIILQVLPENGTEEQEEEFIGEGSTRKRQKVMQLVTRVAQGATSINRAVAKVSGEVLSVDLPGTNH